jgi:hypothetical protein
MQIVEQTATLLKLKAKTNWGLMGVLFGTPFFLAGIGIIILFGNLVDLKCDRSTSNQVACELTSSNLLSKHITQIPSGQLVSADVQESSSSDGNTYRVLLLTKSGTIAMTEFFSGGTDINHQKDADKINDFLKSPDQSSLRISQDHRWFAYPFGGLFALIGGGIIYGSIVTKFQKSCIFDKTADRMWLKQQSLFQTETREIVLRYIREVQMVEGKDSDGDKTYSTKVILKSGEEISLQISSSTPKYPKVVASINQFLGISPRP